MSSIESRMTNAFADIVEKVQALMTVRIMRTHDNAAFSEDELQTKAEDLRNSVEQFITACTEKGEDES